MRMVIRSTLGELPNAYVQLGRITDARRCTPTPASSTSPPTTATSRRRSDRNSSRSGTRSSTPAIGDATRIGEPERAVRHREARIRFVPAGGPERVRREPGPSRPSDRAHAGLERRRTPSSPANTCATTSTSSTCRTSPTRCRWARRSRRCRAHRVLGCSSGNQRPPTRRGTTGDRSRPDRERIRSAGVRREPRLLTVLLPQAEMVTVNLSSYLTEGTQELFGPWMIQRGIFRSLPQRRAAAQQGRAWMLTPWSQLTLVHAVEKPLAPPVIEVPAVGVPNTGVQRFVGETFAVLSGVVQNHAKSTGSPRRGGEVERTGRRRARSPRLTPRRQRARRRLPTPPVGGRVSDRPRRRAAPRERSHRSTSCVTSSRTRSIATSPTRQPRRPASASTSRP